MLERARASLWTVKYLLSIALDHCTIGQALAAGQRAADGAAADPEGGAREAGAALDLAIATMRRASRMDFLANLYLIRAHHRRTQSDPAGARADLESALAIATPPGMRTTIAEAALLAGHLELDRARDATAAPAAVPEAARHWTQADRLIRETGYGRREAELHLLEARLKHHQSRPWTPDPRASDTPRPGRHSAVCPANRESGGRRKFRRGVAGGCAALIHPTNGSASRGPAPAGPIGPVRPAGE